MQRARVRELENQLWKQLQVLRNDSDQADFDVLGGVYDSISQALDTLGPGEEHYDEKEDDLNVLELRLETLEAELYNTPGSPEYLTRPRSLTATSLSRHSMITARSDDHRNQEDLDSPMQQYLSKLGDVRIIRERLYELASEKAQYLDIQREREAVGRPQYQPNIEFLADYDRIHKELFSQLQVLEQEASILARQAGLEPAATSEMINELTNTNDVRMPETSVEETIEPAETKTSPLPQRFSPSNRVAIRSKRIVARQRINDWLFEMLKISAIERARHKAILGNPNLEDTEWLRLVRRYWQRNQGGRGDVLADPSRDSNSSVLGPEISSPADRPNRGRQDVMAELLGIGQQGFQRNSAETPRTESESVSDKSSEMAFSPLASSFSTLSHVGECGLPNLGVENGNRFPTISSTVGLRLQASPREARDHRAEDQSNGGQCQRGLRSIIS